jgi:basic amino acid/polyamine antiporter, APA family
VRSTATPARALGLVMCTALVVGNTIGMGIFMLPASLAPYGLNAVPAWLITAAGSIFIAWVFAGLARTFPDDDGPIAYAGRAFGGGIAFTLMWCYWVSTWVTNAVLATGVVGYLSMFFPVLGVNHWLAAITALSLLWLFVLINMRGVRAAGGVQVLSSILKVLPLVGIMVLGLWVLFAPHPQVAVHVPSTPLSFYGVTSASALALYAMLGVESAAVPAGRVRDPACTIPRATFIGTVLVALICTCASLVPILLIPQAELAVSNAPFADLFARLLGPVSGKLLAAFVIVSGLGCLNGWTLILGEITVSFARHGGFPPALGKVNSHGAPTLAFVVTGLFASIMMISSYNDSMAGAFTFLSIVVTAANLPLYFGCALAVLVLWRRGKIPQPGARELRWVAASFLALSYCVWICFGFGGKALLWALLLCAVGVPVYWWYAHVRRDPVAARA